MTQFWSRLCLLFFLRVIFTESLENILSNEDLASIFGPNKPVPEYSLIGPILSGSKDGRSKRSIDDTFAFSALGTNYTFRMSPVSNLISPSFHILHREKNSVRISPGSLAECDAFRGVSEHDAAVTLAVVSCGNMRGVIKGTGEDLVIEPLPERVARRHRRSLRSSPGHIVYRKRNTGGCSLNDVEAESTDGERSYLFSRTSQRISNLFGHVHGKQGNQRIPSKYLEKASVNNLSPSEDGTYYIETAVFVDKDLLGHMKTNFPHNTEKEVVNVVLAMVNAVQLLYHDESLGHKIQFSLKRLDLMHDDPSGLVRSYDIDDFLTSFCSWQHLQNPPRDSDSLHWDHALILTGLDIYTVEKNGAINSAVVGLAPVAGMCTRKSSCTVNEGKHFESVYVVAHEIGHNLGMKHDGLIFGNNCDPSGYLMSPTLGSGKVTWSHCSKKYLDKFLRTPQSDCMRDVPPTPTKHELRHEGQLPGQRFTADQQCMLKYGVGSIFALGQPKEEICKDLHCAKDHFIWTSHPALEGTLCGSNKWCRRGECTERSGGNRRHAYSAPISDGPWSEWTKCDSSCLYGVDGILSSGSTGLSISQSLCRSCNQEYKYKVCSSVRDCSNRARMTLQDFADDACRRIGSEESSLSRFSSRIPVKGISHCNVNCLTTSGSPVVTQASFPDGTACASSSPYPSYCIQGHCKEFNCNSNTRFEASSIFCATASPKPVNDSPESPRYQPTRLEGNILQNPPVSRDYTTYQTESNSGWSDWNPTSECRFSCMRSSKGIQLVSRQCLSGRHCTGSDRNIQLCDPSSTYECSSVETPFEHATKVCQSYSATINQLSGVGMQLEGIAGDPNRGCTVACQDIALQYRFYRVNGRDGWFPFGTECSIAPGKPPSYCLNGICMEFSDNGTPLRNHRQSKGLKTNDLEVLASSLLGINDDTATDKHRKKRNVETTAHRIPGSFNDEFLTALVDHLNSTVVHNMTEKKVEEDDAVDLHNPIFHGNNPLKAQTFIYDGRSFSYKALNYTRNRIYHWKTKYSRCSSTCGEGTQSASLVCMSEDGVIARNEAFCDVIKPAIQVQRRCQNTAPCTVTFHRARLFSDSEVSPLHSHFSKWIVDNLNEIRRKIP